MGSANDYRNGDWPRLPVLAAINGKDLYAADTPRRR
jgi:hypothetical protein